MNRTALWGTGSLLGILGGVTCLLAGIMAFLTMKNALTIEIATKTEFNKAVYCADAMNAVTTFFLVISIAAGIIGIAGIILSVIKCGRLIPLNEPSTIGAYYVQETWFDRIFAEILLTIGCGASAGLYPAWILIANWYGHSNLFRHLIESRTELTGEQFDTISGYGYFHGTQMLTPCWVELILGLLIAVCVLSLDLLVLQAIAKKLKNRHFWKGTLIGWIVCKLVAFAESDDKLYRKVFLIVIAGVLLSMTWVGAAIVIILAIIFLPRYLKRFQAIREGAAEIRSGNLAHKIPVEGEGQLDALAKDINAISQAQYEAIQKELKTQRLKTDLITNVSHDLKTPLTSMVTYVDLLKQEGLESENAPEYLEILDEKTERLKRLTEDLFDAAKASSGDIPVNLEKLNMTAIANQALAEMEDHLAKNDIQVILSDKTEDSSVLADGRHLWRIIENLLGNISKYAMPGTRAYIDITEAGDYIRMEVKNMSQEALNIDSDELMERFQRGDESRTTEGSGLGLAIARDLARLMDGSFDIVIDGDLFKAIVELPASKN